MTHLKSMTSDVTKEAGEWPKNLTISAQLQPLILFAPYLSKCEKIDTKGCLFKEKMVNIAYPIKFTNNDCENKKNRSLLFPGSKK